MSKNVIYFIIVIVVGALLGTFIGEFLAMVMPAGNARDLFAKGIEAGLHPARLDLRVIELTFGCIFKFNVTSVLGIVSAAYIFRGIAK
jgi:hypothetical protein